MPRRARHYIPGQPYHIVQRGNNREACFTEAENYQFYLELWRTVSRRYAVDVHAYCLMTNHIHFLATPERTDSLSNTLKVVGSRYAQHFNRRYQRTGTLWEGRHRSSLIQSDRYLLTCYRYIELNPVRAGIVTRPEAYRWSSYRANGLGDSSWLAPHAEYRQLGRHKAEQLVAYRGLFESQLGEQDLHSIRQAAYYGQPLGDGHFCRQIEKKYGIAFGYRKRGRPGKGDGDG